MTDNLLPCPFCGGEAECDRTMERYEYCTGGPNSVHDYGYTVYCTQCGVETHVRDVPPNDRDEAIAAWNRRAGQASPLTDATRQTISQALDYVIQDVTAQYQTLWDMPDEALERALREDTELNKLIDAKRVVDNMTGTQLVPFHGHVTDEVYVTTLQFITTRQDGRDVGIRLPSGYTVAKWVEDGAK